MNRLLKIFISSILAGAFIALGSTVYCMVYPSAGKVVASFLFGLGLFTVIQFKLYLYTGKIGFVLDNKVSYLLDLLICFIGNVIGAVAIAFLFKYSRSGESLVNASKALVDAKYNDSWYSILFLSIGCGMMIYLAVKGHQICPYPIGKAAFVFLPVMLFILCGFEHVVANAAYFAYAGVFDLKTVLYFVLMLLGNSIGSIILDILFKLCLPKEEKKAEALEEPTETK